MIMVCAACGTTQDHNTIRCEQCSKPLVFAVPFACPRCGAVSHNPNDAAHRYCGRCHLFVEDAPPYWRCQPQETRMTETEMPMEFTTHMLKTTVETLIDLDEPEAILPTLRLAAERQKGKRWQALAHVLGEAEIKLDQLLNAKPAGPDFTKPEPEPAGADAEAKSE